MKQVLVLPGTIWQIPLINRINAKGYEIHLVNPVWNEGVSNLASHFVQSDIFDFDRIVSYCKEHDICAVLSDECDIATDLVSRLNEAIGAKSIGDDLARLFTSKFAMREFCQANNLNPIPHALCATAEQAHSFFGGSIQKAIIKPLDSNASHGVFTICSHEDIDKHFDEAMEFSRNSHAVVIEQFIEGTEFTVDGVMTPEGHKTLAISEKFHYEHNLNIAKELYFTQRNNRFDYDLLRKTNNRLLEATGLTFGLTHVEYKYWDGVYYLIEMAARGGGNLISAIIAPHMSGIDNYGLLIDQTLGNESDYALEPQIQNDRAAVLKFLDLPFKEGHVTDIQGLDYLENEPCIKSYRLYFNVGDFVSQPKNDSARVGYYIACAETEQQLKEVMLQVEQNLQINCSEEE